MNIIIVGCGQVGQNLAEQLIDDGNNVTVIDKLYENESYFHREFKKRYGITPLAMRKGSEHKN